MILLILIKPIARGKADRTGEGIGEKMFNGVGIYYDGSSFTAQEQPQHLDWQGGIKRAHY
jgi:hypothetical protein